MTSRVTVKTKTLPPAQVQEAAPVVQSIAQPVVATAAPVSKEAVEAVLSEEAQQTLQAYLEVYADLTSQNAFAKFKRLEALRSKLASSVADVPPESRAILKSPLGSVMYNTPRSQSVVVNSRFIEVMGVQAFTDMASVTVTTARKYLTEVELDKVLDVQPSTTRSIDYVKLEPTSPSL